VASQHCRLGGRLPPRAPRQRHAHRSPPAADPGTQGPARTHRRPGPANRRLLLRAGKTLSDRGRDRLRKVFDLDDPTGKLQTAWKVKEQLRALLRTGSLQDAAAAKDRLEVLVARAAQPETTRLWRTVCRWWQEIEVLIVTGATTAKVEANNTAIQHLKRTGRGFVNSRNYTTRIMLRSAARTAV
jgi:transposase